MMLYYLTKYDTQIDSNSSGILQTQQVLTILIDFNIYNTLREKSNVRCGRNYFEVFI